MHTCNPSMQEAKVGGWLQVKGQPKLCQEKNKRNLGPLGKDLRT